MASVLIVEDDASIQNMYKTALTQSDFEVTTANSGAEALLRVEEKSFDIILLDMLMMGMSGIDFLKTYDVRTKSPATKVIALTNMNNPAIEEKAKELGSTAYLDKSEYEPKQLIEYIRGLLSQAPSDNQPA